ncbi:chemotaxis protein [Pseudoalteromonas luteoviolacea]|uniref:Chemotaxis protein n=1 Tax=Pseudoalteromonas luteoviolacea TaxID=43657 RepID=A0A1C0TQV2_9GAMM|nr:chemotaxis protein [Pseudoalteromonas luteoviolacea]MBQ4811593.1 chemotaxis protein [Pseudoalteromonas luteoviolacea]OCQ21336.1 chemotaxis protein [Pseudoalteromonas luteoviolacea]
MMSLSDDSKVVENFVRVAQIIANLEAILSQAKNLSLTAKNARVVALRAGDAALGFKPITNFIDEFSEQTISSTTKISNLSNQLFKVALELVRCSQYYEQVCKLRKEVRSNQVENMYVKAVKSQRLAANHLSQALSELENHFEDIQKQMQSAEYIAVTSRVEATNAGEFSDSLQSVSDFIASAAKTIKTAVVYNLSEIHTLRGLLR